MNVYCMTWYAGEENPLTEDLPTNSRAEALMEGSRKTSENKNKSNSKEFELNIG